jgi:hypothetical protein
MSAGIEIYNYVSNQKGTPALYSDILANRPAAGFLGRLFISTDTLEIYRDTGTAWALISGGGGSVNIYNSDGTLTAARTMTMSNHSLTFEGGANDARLIMSANNNVPRIFSFRTANVARWDFRVTDNETGSDAGGNWYLRAHNDAGAFTFAPISANRKTGEKTLFAQANITAGTEAVTSVFNIAGITYAAGLTMIGGNAHAAQFNNFTLANSGSLTFANSSFVGANGNVLRLQANSSGTITMQAASPGLRAATASLNQIQYNTTNGSAITYTHAANIQGLGILQLFAAGSLTVTNGYGLLLNDLNEYGYPSTGAGALSITNRWGIYQDSTTDANYLGGSVLIGTTTNAGYKTDVNGTFRAVSTVTLSSLAGTGTRMVVADATGILSTQAIPGGGGISGSGTTNYVAKFTGASSIGNSQLFDNGTNVGIGTITPAYLLDVNGSGRIGGVLMQSNTPFITGGNISVASGSIAIGTVSANSLNFFTSNAFRGSFASTGELLVNGTLNPYAQSNRGNLTITGTSTQILAFTNGTVGTGYIYYNGTNLEIQNNTGAVLTYTNSTIRQSITSGGNVLINTTTDAGYRTDINGTLRTTQDAYFATTSGNVGIGTTSPVSKFEVRDGDASVTTASSFSFYNNNRNTVPSSAGVSMGGMRWRSYSTGTTYETGTQILSFTEAAWSSISAPSYISFQTTASGSVTPNERMRITSDGKVLINTTTDSGQRLQVAGTARIFGTALPHLLIEQTAATGNVELQFSATDASYPAIIRSKAAQSIAFKDGTNSNLDIYSAGQLSIGGGGAPFGSTNTLTVLAGTAPTATASDCFTLYSKDITAGNAAPHFITENGAIVKIYQETTSVAAAAFTANSGTAINDASTFDGYTLRQIVKALRNLGILN